MYIVHGLSWEKINKEIDDNKTIETWHKNQYEDFLIAPNTTSFFVLKM